MSVSSELRNAKTAEEFDAIVQRRRRARMDKIDKMSPELREIINEYGFTVVNAFTILGVTRANHICHLVETVLNEFSPTRGAYSSQGRRGDGDGISGGPMKRPTSDGR